MTGWARAVRGRLRGAGGQILQAAVAAAVAWQISTSLLRLPQTIFAPLAAMSALLGGAGGRGRRTLSIVFGALVGVLVGELVVLAVRPELLVVAAAALLALVAVALFTTENLPMIQGGIAAVIVVGTGSAQSGLGRAAGVLVGGAVALMFSQVLFAPSPVRLVTEAAAGVLRPVADALAACAHSLDTGDPAPAARAAAALRPHAGDAGGLDAIRDSARSTCRYTVRGHRERARFATVDARFAHVPELWAAALVLCGTTARDPRCDPQAAGPLATLAGLVGELAADATDEGAAAHTRVAAAYSGASALPLVAGVAVAVRAVAGDPAVESAGRPG